MRLGLPYAPTQYNPAGHPSRGRSIPPPTAAIPPWWASERLHSDFDRYGNLCFTQIELLWNSCFTRIESLLVEFVA